MLNLWVQFNFAIVQQLRRRIKELKNNSFQHIRNYSIHLKQQLVAKVRRALTQAIVTQR
jgi:hypothetical protein